MNVFGTLPDGRIVHAVEIAAGDLSARILTLGATLQDVRLAGVDHTLTLGSDDAAAYLGPLHYFGAIVGPVANRIRDAAATVDGRTCHFPANQDGRHCLHSGAAGTHLKIWDVVAETPDSVTLAVDLPDGEGGFPGNRRITARFTILPPATLRLDLSATTDAPTILNVVNHSYWNLDGTDTWAGHRLRVAADHYLPVDDQTIPTGEIRAVDGTGFDLRDGAVPVPGDPGFDHNFCLSPGTEPLREVLWLTGASGVRMAVATTEPGVQIYDGGHTKRPGKGLHEGFAIEPQHWPDAPHQPGFPQIAVPAGGSRVQVTEWRIARG